MAANYNYVKLILSGTIMSGFHCSIPRIVLTMVSKEQLIDILKREMLAYVNAKDMWMLAETIGKMKLHIHVEYNVDSSTVYICDCDQSETKTKNDI